jgi:ubiquinone/menaquinone biosynthesis C-methylase UbiE
LDKLKLNKIAYETEDALEKYSSYFLYRNEKVLFEKYLKKDKKILDLACGGGRTTVCLYENGYRNIKGIDLSEPLIKMAKNRFPYLDFEIGSYAAIEEKDNSFDYIIISHNGLDYAYPEEMRITALKETSRVLKRGGLLIYSSHNIKSLYCSPYFFKHPKRAIWKIKNTFRAFKAKDYILDLGMYTYYLSPEIAIEQTCEQGFKLVETLGFQSSRNPYFNKFISPFIHYVFEKVI